MGGTWMEQTVLQILNMSLVGTYCILAVLLVRLLLKRQPKIFSYVLWSVVLFRLLCPTSFESPFSAFHMTETSVMTSQGPQHVRRIEGLGVWMEKPSEETEDVLTKNEKGMKNRNDMGTSRVPAITENGEKQENNYYTANAGKETPDKNASSNEGAELSVFERIGNWLSQFFQNESYMKHFWFITAGVWLAGACGMLGGAVVSAVRLKKRLEACKEQKGYSVVEQLETAIVFGIVHPRIYLPAGLSEKEIPYILEHERIHIRRGDYLVKLLAFLALCIHWFNPLVWAGFSCMGRDMEMSCDEAVLKKMGGEIRRDYSSSLLSLACGRKFFGSGPLAFGEKGVKERIKNVLGYRKPKICGMVLAAFAIMVSGLVLLSNPASSEMKKESAPKPSEPEIHFPDNGYLDFSEPEIHFPDNGHLDFSDLEGIVFWHGSGAGAWRTTVTVQPDGTFSGCYEDGNTDASYLYTRGSADICYFNGQFSDLTQTGPYEYRMQCVSFQAQGTPGEEEIIDDVRYITTEPYGFQDAGECILYLPGKQVSELPEDFRTHGFEKQGVLTSYGLYNVGDGSSYIVWPPDPEYTMPPSPAPEPTLSPSEIAVLQQNYYDNDHLTFADVSGREFSCGMYDGGFSIYILEDGTFRGAYYRRVGEEGGSHVYERCDYKGRFSGLTKVGPYEYSMKCESLEIEGTPGEVTYSFGEKTITANPPYFDSLDEFRIYLPGKRKRDLPEHFYKFLIWWIKSGSDDGVIDDYLFYNVQKDAGFLHISG